jgi:hypothetical protein
MNAEETIEMGTPEKREFAINNILKSLGVATLGELIWVRRNLERNFSERTQKSTREEQDKYKSMQLQTENLLQEYQSLIEELSKIKNNKELNEKTIKKL